MTNLTMGQRIAAQRKLHGLSQEALAAQMGVSRQAISKWESDGAIPEVDKLIALGRMFGVSVGWLLGTETECRYDPEAGLNEAQTEMVEQIVARCQPPKRPLRHRILAAACAVILAGGMMLHYRSRIDALTADNVTTRSQLAQLAEDNRRMQEQLNAMEEILEKQDTASKLLSDYGITGCYASEDMEEVTMTFVLTPKVYREAVEAKIAITNPNGYSRTMDCAWNGIQYILHLTVPMADGYEFRLILAGEDNWQEESLNDYDPYLGMLKTGSAFYVDRTDPKAAELNGPWSVQERVYAFNVRVYPPYVQPKSAMGYQDIVLTLYHNGEVIWSESWKQEFQNAYGSFGIYSLPVAPDVSVELPELAEGDTLRLELTATLTEGQVVTSVLDERTVGPA